METLIVFSHLRWDFVFQRPQQLLFSMSEKRQAGFFEESVVTPFSQQGKCVRS